MNTKLVGRVCLTFRECDADACSSPSEPHEIRRSTYFLYYRTMSLQYLQQCENAHGPIQIRGGVAPLKADSIPVRAHVRASPLLFRQLSVDGLNEPTMHDILRSVLYLQSDAI